MAGPPSAGVGRRGNLASRQEGANLASPIAFFHYTRRHNDCRLPPDASGQFNRKNRRVWRTGSPVISDAETLEFWVLMDFTVAAFPPLEPSFTGASEL